MSKIVNNSLDIFAIKLAMPEQPKLLSSMVASQKFVEFFLMCWRNTSADSASVERNVFKKFPARNSLFKNHSEEIIQWLENLLEYNIPIKTAVFPGM